MAESTLSNATLTQDQVERILINPLQQVSTYLSVGFPSFSSNGEPIKIPSLTSFGTAAYTTEGSAIAEVSASTSEVTLLPSSVKAMKAITRVSNELVRQSVVNVESAFSLKIAMDIGRLLDAALWNGDGTGGAPTGIAQMTGFTNAGTVSSGSVTSDHLVDMQTSALNAYVMPGAMHWAFSPTTFGRIRKLTDNYGSRVLAPSLAVGAPPTLLGDPYTVTTALPDSCILLFDPSKVAVGFDQRASITILSELYGATDELGIRVVARYDTAALNPTAIVKKTLT